MAYPAVLLCLMAVILAVLLVQVLPVFSRVYAAMAGGTAAAGYRYLQVGYVVGGVALAVTAVIAAVLAVTLLQARTARGRVKLEAAAEKIPALRGVVRKQALARYVWVLDLYLASGMPAEDSLRAAAEVVTCGQLKKAARGCADAVAAGKRLEEACWSSSCLSRSMRGCWSGHKSGTMDRSSPARAAVREDRRGTEHLTGLVKAGIVQVDAGRRRDPHRRHAPAGGYAPGRSGNFLSGKPRGRGPSPQPSCITR
ncbi:MAG: type II secretion system F family protein [Gemmiger formicilis]|uniref:type II secretion system F family protein n=1 Tax=Gemmiger formicilis TaxID=745368 RepID=UPI003996AD7D